MTDKKITDKIKESLTPEDMKVFEGAIESMISEKVAERVKLAEEEMKNKYDSIAEEYVTKTVSEQLETEKTKLVEEYDTKIVDLEKKIVTKLDSFLEHVITEQISDSMIEKIALNEVLLPVVEGVKKVFFENNIDLDSEGEKIVSEKTKAIEELEKNLSESIAKNMELEERLEKTATFLLISEKTDSMTDTQKSRVLKMFKDKSFDEVKEKIDTFVEMVKESSDKKVNESKTEKKTIIAEQSDVIKEEKKIVPDTDAIVEQYDQVKASNYYL
jgi:hypothetical protein